MGKPSKVRCSGMGMSGMGRVSGRTAGPSPRLGVVVTHVASEAVAAGLAGQSRQDETLLAACRGSQPPRQGSQLLQHC